MLDYKFQHANPAECSWTLTLPNWRRLSTWTNTLSLPISFFFFIFFSLFAVFSPFRIYARENDREATESFFSLWREIRRRQLGGGARFVNTCALPRRLLLPLLSRAQRPVQFCERYYDVAQSSGQQQVWKPFKRWYRSDHSALLPCAAFPDSAGHH